jgi:hypothetical protein
MSTVETLDEAVAYLGSSVFDGYQYAWAFNQVLMSERDNLQRWNSMSDETGIVLQPMGWVVRMAENALKLKGTDIVSPEDIVIEALTILDMTRNAEGRLPSRSINNYMALKYALEHGDCQDWGILGMAKGIIFAQKGKDDVL